MSQPAHNYSDNLVALRKDAVKVVQDLSSLTEKLSESGKEYTQEVKDNLMLQISKQVEDLSLGVKNISEEVKRGSKQADQHVKAHPYAYILGAVGLGFLMGKIRTSSKQ